MSEPSKGAWDRARKLSWPQLAGQDITWLAVALQELMDERDDAKLHAAECYEVATNACARRDELDLRCSRLRTRAETAEADAKLAWRRVTELQTRCTELVLEHRNALTVLRSEREFANAAAAGFEESARYPREDIVSADSIGNRQEKTDAD